MVNFLLGKMLGSPIRCCTHIKHVRDGVLALTSNNIGALAGLGRRHYAKDNKDKGGCCKDIVQTEGRKVEPWPKSDPPPPAWRCECPRDPQPPNYDPYRIKVPDIVVPPLPPSNAKRTCVVYASTDQQHQGNQPTHHHQGYGWPQQEAPQEEEEKDVTFLGILKGFFDKPMLDCTRTKGPCSVKPVPDPPPCPPPPPPPFPWIYVWAVTSFLGTMGLIYKLYLWKEEYDKVNDNVPIWRPRRRVKRPYHDMDLPPCVQYLIVGTGAAGWAAYRAIMEHDKTAKVFFVTKEDVMPYRRPPLSKNMWWNAEPPDVMTLNYLDAGKRTTMYLSECRKFMDPVKFYRKKTGPAVSIASGWCALRVDAENHILYIKTMCGEVPMYYERLLLALGSKAKNLGVFKSAPKSVRDKTITFRTIRDLEIAYRKVKEAKHVVVLGAGVLGTELAWTLGRMNRTVERPEGQDPIEIVHMYKDKGILSGVIPEYLGEWAAEKIKCEGVKVMPKTQIYDAFETPDGRLELTLSNGSSLVTDYVIVAIGANPRDEMAEASFLETDPINGGFTVNTELEARTHLYVAGDAASFYSQWHGHRLRMEHYDNAEEQGYVAGANMAGYWLPCNMEPHYWLALGEALEMEVVGEVGACMPTVGIFKPCTMDEDAKREQEQLMKKVDGSGDRPCYKKTEEYQSRYKRGILFYLRDETVVGMLFWNLPPIEDRKEVVTEMLRARPSYKDINLLAELLGFPDTQCVYKSEDDLKLPGPCIKNWRVF